MDENEYLVFAFTFSRFIVAFDKYEEISGVSDNIRWSTRFGFKQTLHPQNFRR